MPQPPPPPPPPPPLAIDADRRALHDLGYLELTKVPEWELLRVRVMRVRPMFACAWVLPYGLLKTSRGYNKGKPAHSASPEPDPHPTKVPDWELLAFCEMMHTRWHKRCAELLDGLRARWFEGCDEGARVGAVAARVATELLDEELFEAGGTHGIWISATHGSVDEKSWEFTGPRFYASVITAALRPHTGCCGEDGAAAALTLTLTPTLTPALTLNPKPNLNQAWPPRARPRVSRPCFGQQRPTRRHSMVRVRGRGRVTSTLTKVTSTLTLTLTRRRG